MEKQTIKNKKINNNVKLKNDSKKKKSNFFSSFLKIIFHGLLLYFASSYLITNTLTWGKKVPNWRRYIPVN